MCPVLLIANPQALRCLKNFPLCLDSEFFHSFLEPLPASYSSAQLDYRLRPGAASEMRHHQHECVSAHSCLRRSCSVFRPSHLRFLCGNFHPLTHMQFEDAYPLKVGSCNAGSFLAPPGLCQAKGVRSTDKSVELRSHETGDGERSLPCLAEAITQALSELPSQCLSPGHQVFVLKLREVLYYCLLAPRFELGASHELSRASP